MKINDLTYVWDYASEEPVEEKEMPFGSERHKASERKRAELMREGIGSGDETSDQA